MIQTTICNEKLKPTGLPGLIKFCKFEKIIKNSSLNGRLGKANYEYIDIGVWMAWIAVG